MGDIAIRAEGLAKKYRIEGPQERYKTLRDTLSQAATSIGRMRPTNMLSRRRLPNKGESIWALRDFSFEVKPGEVIGVIGRNGAGKSTLLKILARITEPTRGLAEIRGRVGSLLEVGAGFHPELSGRENIYLNSAILGMKRKEVERKFDEIVSFAELEKFIDTPVKRYSSGMYMRLAFSVAAHLEPEVLLVDEVLAVGDAAFQKKCVGQMENVAKDGRTVLFVSHNMGSVRGLCERAIWLNEGICAADGNVHDVVQRYLDTLTESSFSYVNRDYGLVVEEVALKNSSGGRTSHVNSGDDLMVEVRFNAERKIKKPYIYLVVKSLHGTCFVANMQLDGHRPDFLDGKVCVSCRFKSLPLLPQSYTVTMAIRASDGKDVIMPAREVASFSVGGDLRRHGFKGERVDGLAAKSFPVVVPYEWTLPDGAVLPISIEASQEVSPA